jgi:glycosyltransferase involved in cell wall biosynthesis
MSSKLVAIVHNADPQHFPHILRQAEALKAHNHQVWAIGTKNKNQPTHSHTPFRCTTTFSLPPFAHHGPLHFLYFMLRTFVVLWKYRPDKLQPIDYPALLPCWIHSVLRGIPLYYFSFEDLPHMPNLFDRPVARLLWGSIERLCIGRARSVAVVAAIDARSFLQRYRINQPFVIRNVASLTPLLPPHQRQLRHHFGWHKNHFVLFYHGILQFGRGIERTFSFLRAHPNTRLAIAGYGPDQPRLMQLAHQQGVAEQIGWYGPYVFSQLPPLIQDADVGIALIENICKGYEQMLPCKLFDYVHATIPVVVSPLPEMKSYVESSGIGLIADPQQEHCIHQALLTLMNNRDAYARFRGACIQERDKTNWETESKNYLAFLEVA